MVEALDEEDRDDLRALLADTPQWRLPQAEWDRLGQVLDLLDRALGHDGDGDADADGVRRAVVALTRASPHRVRSGLADTLGRPESGPAPERTRDLVGRLLKRVGPAPRPEAPADGDAGDDEAE